MVILTSGLLFYWIGWLFFIVVAFFVNHKGLRVSASYVILLTIACSSIHIGIDDYRFSLSFVILLIASLMYYVRLPNKFYILPVTFTVMIGYSAIIVWKSISPMWLFLPEEIILPGAVTILVCVLIRDFKTRLIVSILAICCGEWLYSLILISYHIMKTSGDLIFLDQLSFTLLLILLFTVLQSFYDLLYIQLRRYKQKARLPYSP